ncbi:hypothetical protein LJR027_003516 [Terrabacter sp. LjRoot27]|jgi:hypothetical protein|uniref:hypothetical protein n=1 Tax=Terrabacter sp. LjRoot27 TaxID=3342306 RepID=UPI003ECF7A40
MIRRTTVASGLAAVVLSLTGAMIGAAPASADDGTVSATSPDGRAYGSAYLDFRSALRVNINDLYVNDRCPGDGVAATINLYVGHGGTIQDMIWIKVGERTDSGGCGSDPVRTNTYYLAGYEEVDAFAIRVCGSGGCSGYDWRMNPYAH